MQMLQCGVNDPSSIQTSYNRDQDVGIVEYRKNCTKSMREKAQALEDMLNHRTVSVLFVACDRQQIMLCGAFTITVLTEE